MEAVYLSTNIPALAELREVDVPKPADGEVLIRNVTTSSNHIDVTLSMVLGYEAIGGGESAGTVVEIGHNVNNVAVDDRVSSSTVHGSLYLTVGSGRRFHCLCGLVWLQLLRRIHSRPCKHRHEITAQNQL